MPNTNFRTFQRVWKSKKLLVALNNKQDFDIQNYSTALLAIIRSWYNNWQQDINIYTYNEQELILISLIIDPKVKFSALIKDIEEKRIYASKVQGKVDNRNQPSYFVGDYAAIIDHGNNFDYAIKIDNNGITGYFNVNLIDEGLNNNYLDNIEKILIKTLTNINLALDKLTQISNSHWKKIYKLSSPLAYKYSTDTPLCIQLIEQAKRHPKKIALKDENKQLTYKELEDLSAKTAVFIKKNLLKTKARIGICLQRSTEFIIALIGTLRSGASFVPLDPLTPYNRLEFIIQDSELDLLIIDKEYKWLNKIKTKAIPIQYIISSKFSRSSSILDKIKISLDQEAYIIYTSGTSGIPKGVSISHKSLTFYSNIALRKFKIRKSDRVLQFASLNFDAMIEEVFPCLLVGAKLILRDNKSSHDIQHFLNMISKFRITVLDLPTGYWREVLHYLENFNLKLSPQLRTVIVGGRLCLVKMSSYGFL